ncbi:uncharacterized protein LOC118738165 [Rhagoletis pomonella]|uniref:uncharacterized protein LOC118738165 n=1 Tax=Rhagoletis pomonella TaxID=28610 RepID=UPI0017837B70|nr:uncharacterized protein LOC118738165 [Rhagoletis pomonella]
MATTMSMQQQHRARHGAPLTTDPPFMLGRAPWWQPTAPAGRRRQHKRKIAFTEALKDFLQNVSFHCYNKLVEPRRRFHERFFWTIFHITTLSVLIAFLGKIQIFEGQLLSTVMYDSLFPISKVPFPTISICSLNRISNASVNRYAEKLNMKDPQKRGVNYFYNQIKKLSRPYSRKDINDDDYEDFLEFQNFLDIYDTTDAESFYDTRDRMKVVWKNIFGWHCRLDVEKNPNCIDIVGLHLKGVSAALSSIDKEAKEVNEDKYNLPTNEESMPFGTHVTVGSYNLEVMKDLAFVGSSINTINNASLEVKNNSCQPLTPNCKDLFVRCRLAGEDIDCATKFTETLTASGFCCSFNADGLYAKPRPTRLSLFTASKGLVLLLNASSGDDFFKESISSGFMFYIYPHGYYADTSSGSIRERFTPTGVHTYISIEPSIMQTVHEARILPALARKCLFEDERPRIYGKKYSHNKCITRCRMNSMLVLCNCLLFTYPEELLDVDREFAYCTLRHKPCLERYYFKWSNVITERAYIPGLELEMEDALYCPQCLPLCSSVRYAIHTNELPLVNYYTHTFPEIFHLNVSNLALVDVFFGTPHIQFFRRLLKDNWFEVLGLIGNLASIVTGFSLVGICEVFYFFGRQLFMVLKSEMISDRRGKKKKSETPLLILP